MDFFEAQARAKRRTNRLVVLFALAVLGTIAASYVAAILIVGQTRDRNDRSYSSHPSEPPSLVYWDPTVFAAVAAATVAIVGLASLYKWSQMRHGGSAVAELVGGRRVDPRTTNLHERRLLNVVEEMSIASGTPVPAVYVLDREPGLNAFAAGLTTSDAVVAVTRGTLEKLTRDELQGVVAHEFSHILNGDMRLNVKLTAIVFGILVIGLIGRGILESLGRGRVRSSGGGKKGGGIAVILAIGLALLIVGYVGYFFGRLIQAAVSRQREFLADASAVQFTRNPGGIAGALKKIGGYALGSALTDKHASEIGHFFFAQGFRSFFGGLWATHPPLGQRIRAIDPRWDGQLFEPPEVVDVARESFASAGLAGPSSPHASTAPPLTREIVREGEPVAAVYDRRPSIPFTPSAVTASIGALTEEHFRQARALLDAVPAGLRDATRAPATAIPLVYALLLAPVDAAARDRQLGAIKQHSSDAHADAARTLAPAVADLADAVKLPLFQLCLPALRTLEAAALDRFVTTLDELVHSDAEVTAFEFALQKMLLRQLSLARARAPRAPTQFHSFQPLADDIAIVLSALARAGANEPGRVSLAFAAGVGQLPLIASRLALAGANACSLEKLDTALDRLAGAALPIKQRVLAAAAQVIGADRVVTPREADLYRAIAAAIDCPVPVLAA